MAPLVSIGLPVYNGDDFIRKCLDSLLVQSYSNLEIIICDNASTDTTEDICRAYADRDARIKYYRNEKNLGAAPNYNKCFEVSTGQYFKWIAHDDWLSENYIEDCVDILETHDEFVMAFGMPQEMLDDDTIFLDGDFTVEMTGPIAPLEHFAHAIRIVRPDHAIFGVFRSEALKRTTGHGLYYGSDRALVAEAALLGRFAAVPEAIFYNRIHPKRSRAIDDKVARIKWQDTSNDKKFSTEHLSMLKHFLQISGRYPEIASRSRIIRSIFWKLFNPRQLLRYIAELIGMVSPNLYLRLRSMIYGVMKLFRRRDKLHY